MQIDASYFTTPTVAKARKPPLPQSSKSVPAAPSVSALPPDLAKPRELVATANKKPSLEVPRPEKDNSELQNKPHSEIMQSTGSERQIPTTGQKRPAPSHAPLQDYPTTSDKPQPRPPIKRQKKDKGNIFIPKKPNKVRLVVSLNSVLF